MALGPVSICNQALTRLGCSTIGLLTEDTEEARACNAVYRESLDELIEEHPWNCAVQRRVLTPLSTTPDFDWDYEYQLPINPKCLQVLEVNGERTGYEIAGDYLLTDDDSVNLKYIGKVDDETKLSVLQARALAALIASKIAYRLLGSRQAMTDMHALYVDLLAEAIARDAQEVDEVWPDAADDTWIQQVTG